LSFVISNVIVTSIELCGSQSDVSFVCLLSFIWSIMLRLHHSYRHNEVGLLDGVI